jgi:hypothetical protein
MKKLLLIPSLMIACAVTVTADQWDVLGGEWFPPPGLPSSAPVQTINGTAQPSGTVVQACVSLTSDGQLAPTVDAGNDYLEVPNNRLSTSGTGVMGNHNGMGGSATGTGAPAGHYRMGIVANAGEYVFTRCFSAVTIPESAYYADSPTFAAQMVSGDSADSGLTLNTFNPAYTFPGFNTSSNWYVSDEYTTATVDGLVPTGSGDNELRAADVQIVWTNLTTGQNGSFQAGDGSWTSDAIGVSGPNLSTNVVQFTAVGSSARTGLPVSSSAEVNILVVPEPGMIGLLLCAALLVSVRKNS